ncbi:MAG: hypothetical protein KatS3mg076_2184 [Candidatus Binatia bacterium]|nr:MAG: hypothetical protein KatS3mg076_2184 [Candidatus Binatia bacterium]
MPRFDPELGLVLTAAVSCVYAFALVHLLRREDRSALTWIFGLSAVSLALRLVFAGDYPAGLHEDEPKIFACAYLRWREGHFFAEDCTGLPVLLTGLFQVPLYSVFGPTQWTIRTYSLVTSVLCVPAAYAAARSFGLRVSTGLAAGALAAVLPWSIFWGRISMGGELPFHTFLLVAALARFCRSRGGVAEILYGSLALCLLLYDYWAGRTMLALPILAALLSRGRYRVFSLLVLLLAAAGFWPYLSWDPPHAWGGANELLLPELRERPFSTLAGRTLAALEILLEPKGLEGALTVAAAAVHPPVVLALAVLGLLHPSRRTLFLAGGFAAGFLPAVVSYAPYPSAHRMILAFPFLLLSASAAFEFVPWARVRAALLVVVLLAASYQSVRFYFSDAFWPESSRARFTWENTAVLESLPWPLPWKLVVSPNFGYFYRFRQPFDRDSESLDPRNWFPPEGKKVTYVFSPHEGRLLPFYLRLFGSERVRSFGRAFRVDLEPGDWSWLRRHGWTYEASCGERHERARIPVLHHRLLSFRGLRCPDGKATHRWLGRWRGPDADLELVFTGTARILRSDGRVFEAEGYEKRLPFSVRSDDELEIEVESVVAVLSILLARTEAGYRVPDWEWVEPLEARSSQRPRSLATRRRSS